jgi:hypothetical protein
VFSVMELLHGETLGDLVDAEGPLPPARAAAIMLQICSALQAAHERGIIHRDLKPDNCFRTPRTSNPDFIKVLDFGIARVTPDASRAVRAEARARTEVGCIIGTPDYMAPEQARAEPFDHRVDVYAAGGLFFELLTGRRPYEGGSAAELLAAHLHLPVPDPGALVPSLCPALRDVVRRAMAKDPDDRYRSMAALGRAIGLAMRDQQRWGSTTRRIVERTAAVGAALALAVGYWALGQPPRERASIAFVELGSARLALAMQPSPPRSDERRPMHVKPDPIMAPPRDDEPSMLAEVVSTRLRGVSIAAPRRAPRAKRTATEPQPAIEAPRVIEAPVDDAGEVEDPLPEVTDAPTTAVPEPETMAAPAHPRDRGTDLKDPFVDGAQ